MTLLAAFRKHALLNETTPLLASSSSIEEPPIQGYEEPIIHTSPPKEDDDTPLPKLQIFFLCLARIVEPVAFFGIFPFINKMIWETGGMDEEDVGFYSGLIVGFLLSPPHQVQCRHLGGSESEYEIQMADSNNRNRCSLSPKCA
jgi:hypothetical protein